MKKINFFTFDDILQKRTLQSSRKQTNQNSKINKRISQEQEEMEVNQNEILMHILQEFKANKRTIPPNFSSDIKMQVVQLISKKMNLKLNANKIVGKMKIKRIQHIQIIEKPSNKLLNQNQMSESKKLDCMIRRSSKGLLNPKKFSYFVLTGNIHKYEKQQENLKKKSYFDDEQVSNEVIFFNWKQFQTEYPSYKKVNSYSQFMGFGNAFSSKSSNEYNKEPFDHYSFKQQNLADQNKKSKIILGEDCVFVEIQNPQQGDDYINHTGMDYEKMAKIIQSFPIFKSLGKKTRNFVQFFEFKQYHKNQQIYSIGDPIDKFYLLLKGQVVFQEQQTNPIQTAVATPQGSRKSSLNMQMTIKTQTVSSGSYFGQEQMIFQKQQRVLAAKCKSSKCQILQIPKQKFDRMLQYSDFYQCIKKAAEIKFIQRLQKLRKNKQIRNKFVFTELNEDNDQLVSPKIQNLSCRKTMPFFGSPKKSVDGRFKVMHGNVIRQFSQQQKQKMSETVQFSMLKVNPDMYEKTVDKFRKYKVKPRQKYIPEVNWQLKRVWKVLNLENILREQAQVNSPEGRKFYDSHQRYVCQLRESKSLRPKTTSSTYRTKLQYIAYLQQFKPQK